MVLVFNRNKKRILPRNNSNGNMEMEEYQTRIGLLCDIAEEASSITEVSTLLERILRVTQHTLGSSITTLFLNDETKTQVHSPITVSKYEDAARHEASIIELEIASLVASNVTPVLVNNVATDARFNPKGKKPSDFAIRSIIAVPLLKGKRVIGVLIGANKDDGVDFTERDFEVLKGFASTEALVLLVSMEITAVDNVNSLTLNHALLEGYRSTVHELATTIDVKDTHAYAHSRRAKEYALLAANSLSLPPQELQAIEFGALLHDIGKIGIDSEILCKPGPLTDKEWNIMYEHPQKGASILEDIPYLKEAMNIVLYHHERYDGKGYPKKLKGDEIPIGARLVAVANAFDTMTTDHSYRAALSINEAMRELIDGTGTQFCPKAIEAFVSAFKKYNGHLPIKKNYEEIKAKAVKEAENLKIKAAKEAKEVKKATRERKATPANIDSEISQGNIRLTLPITVNTEEVKKFGKELEKIDGLTVLMLSHSEEAGHLFLLSLEKPITLKRFIKETPRVENVDRKGKDIVVTLRDESS
jgi:putative nucleotidyltransferase with HDIG domain